METFGQFFLAFNLNAIYFLIFLIKHNLSAIFAVTFVISLGYLEYNVNSYKYIDDNRLIS